MYTPITCTFMTYSCAARRPLVQVEKKYQKKVHNPSPHCRPHTHTHSLTHTHTHTHIYIYIHTTQSASLALRTRKKPFPDNIHRFMHIHTLFILQFTQPENTQGNARDSFRTSATTYKHPKESSQSVYTL